MLRLDVQSLCSRPILDALSSLFAALGGFLFALCKSVGRLSDLLVRPISLGPPDAKSDLPENRSCRTRRAPGRPAHRRALRWQVGDAYIVAAFLPRSVCRGGGGGDLAAAEAEACEGLMWVAGEMLAVVEDYRRKALREIQCRIGLAVGPVIVGVLGRLQPRFHVFGQVLARQASQHWQPLFNLALAAPL